MTSILCVVPAIMTVALMPMGLLTGHGSHWSALGGTWRGPWHPLLVCFEGGTCQAHVPLISLAAPGQCMWRTHKRATPVWGHGSNRHSPQGPLSSSHQDVESSPRPLGLAAWHLLGTVDVLL